MLNINMLGEVIAANKVSVNKVISAENPAEIYFTKSLARLNYLCSLLKIGVG